MWLVDKTRPAETCGLGDQQLGLVWSGQQWNVRLVLQTSSWRGWCRGEYAAVTMDRVDIKGKLRNSISDLKQRLLSPGGGEEGEVGELLPPGTKLDRGDWSDSDREVRVRVVELVVTLIVHLVT